MAKVGTHHKAVDTIRKRARLAEMVAGVITLTCVVYVLWQLGKVVFLCKSVLLGFVAAFMFGMVGYWGAWLFYDIFVSK